MNSPNVANWAKFLDPTASLATRAAKASPILAWRLRNWEGNWCLEREGLEREIEMNWDVGDF